MLEKPQVQQIARLGRARFSQLFKRIFLIAFITMVFIVGCLQSILFIQTRYLLDSELDKNNQQLLSQIQEKIDAVRKDAENLLLRIMVDSDVNAFFSYNTTSLNSFLDVNVRKNITMSMSQWLWNTQFHSVGIYAEATARMISSDYGSSFLGHHPDSEIAILAQAMNLPSGKIGYVMRDRSGSTSRQEEPVPCLTLIGRKNIAPGQSGYCFIDITLNNLLEIIQQRDLDPLSALLLSDANGHLLIDSGGRYTGSKFEELKLAQQQIERIMTTATGAFNAEINGGMIRLSWMKSSFDEMRYLRLVPYSHYATLLNHLVYTTVITLIAGSVVVMIASYILARYAYRPIRLITRAVDNPSPEHGSIQTDDETRYILMKLLLANDQNIQLEQKNLQQFEDLRHAQANVLQAQITPHFLYNALQSIQLMVLMETGNPHSPAAEAVLALSGITRSILQKGVDRVSLQEELSYLDKYIYLKKLSYPDRLKVEIDVPESLLQCNVPKLCLQPLLENVILHGMPDHGVCQAVICARKEGELLIISLDDNGSGMSDEQMQDFNQLTNQDVIFRNQHVGLINLAQRLKLLYGNLGGMHLSRSSLGGLCVTFSLPCQHANNFGEPHQMQKIVKSSQP